jgi:hypothetical protein
MDLTIAQRKALGLLSREVDEALGQLNEAKSLSLDARNNLAYAEVRVQDSYGALEAAQQYYDALSYARRTLKEKIDAEA